MTQLPPVQVADEFTRLLTGGLEEEQSKARLAAGLANPFRTLYLGDNNSPTFIPPDPGFFTAIGARFRQGATEFGQLGVGKWSLMSIPEMVSYATMSGQNEVPGPYVNNRQQMFINGETRDSSSVHIDEFWDELPAPQRILLEQSGQTKDSLKLRGINDGQSFAEFYPTIIQSVRAQQDIQTYAEQHSILSGAAGATAFVGNLIDPLLIGAVATGFGAPAVIGTRTAAKEAVRGVTKATVNKVLRGPTDALLRSNVKRAGQRAAMTRLLTVGGGGITGSNFAITASTAQQLHAMNMGYEDPDFHVDMLAASIGFGLGAILGEFAYRGTRRAIPQSGTKILSTTEHADESLATFHHVSKEAAASRQAGRTVRLPLNTEDVAAADFVQDMVQNYNQVVIKDVIKYLDSKPDINMQELASFLSKMPSSREITEALTDPAGIGSRNTEYMEIYESLEDLVTKRDAAVLDGAGTKTVRKLTSDIVAAGNRLKAIEEENFVLQDTSLGRMISEAMKEKPIEALADTAEKVSLLNEIWDSVVENNQSSLRSRNFVANLHKYSKYVGGSLLLPQQRIKAGIADEDPNVSLISRTGGIINSRGLDGAEVLYDVNGQEVVDAHTRLLEMKRYQVVPIISEVNRLKKIGEDIGQITRNLYRARILGEDVDPKYQKLYSLFFDDFVDDLGTRGLFSGTLKNKFEDFAPMHLNRDIDKGVAHDAFVNAFVRVYSRTFAADDLNAPVNLKTLNKMGLLDDSLKTRINPDTDEPFFELIPSKVSELPEDVRKIYQDSVEDSLRKDASEAYHRLIGQAGTEDISLSDSANYIVRTNSINSKKSRRLLQEVLIDDEVLASGLVSNDLGQITHTYVKGGGYSIVRDEATNQAYGAQVTWNEHVQAMDARSKGNQQRTKALNEIKRLDTRESGRFVLDEQGAALTAVTSNIAASLVGGRNFLAILPMELSLGLLRTVVPKSDLVAQVNSIADSIKRIGNKEQLMHLGIIRETEHSGSRFVWQVNDHLPDQVAKNPLVVGSRHLSHISRVLFLERLSTSVGKSFNFGATFYKMHHHRNRWDKLAGLPKKLPSDPKELRGLAREVGVEVGELTRLHRAGLTDPRMIEAAKKVREVDAQGLRSPEKLSAVLTKTDLGEQGNELYRRMNRFASRDADDFVATATAADVDLTDRPIMNMITSMLSFNAHFYNSTLTRIGDTPYWKQAGAWSWLLGSEISLSILRDLLYNGESPETVREKWEEDTVGQLASAIARLPVQGPMSILPAALYAGTTGRVDRIMDNFTGSAALNMVGSSLDTIYSAGSDMVEEGEISPSTYRKINKNIPGVNGWMLRLLDEARTQFEEDEDK